MLRTFQSGSVKWVNHPNRDLSICCLNSRSNFAIKGNNLIFLWHWQNRFSLLHTWLCIPLTHLMNFWHNPSTAVVLILTMGEGKHYLFNGKYILQFHCDWCEFLINNGKVKSSVKKRVDIQVLSFIQVFTDLLFICVILLCFLSNDLLNTVSEFTFVFNFVHFSYLSFYKSVV